MNSLLKAILDCTEQGFIIHFEQNQRVLSVRISSYDQDVHEVTKIFPVGIIEAFRHGDTFSYHINNLTAQIAESVIKGEKKNE